MNLQRLNIFPHRGCPPCELAEKDVTAHDPSVHECVRWRASTPSQGPSPPSVRLSTPTEDTVHRNSRVKSSLLLQCDEDGVTPHTYQATSVLLYDNRLQLQQDHFSFAPTALPPRSHAVHTHHLKLPGDADYFTTDQHLRQVLDRPFFSDTAKELVVLSDTALYRVQAADERLRCVSGHVITHSSAADDAAGDDGSLLFNATCMCAAPQHPHLVLVGTSNGYVKVYDVRAHGQGTAVLNLSAQSVFATSIPAPTINPHYSSAGGDIDGSTTTRLHTTQLPRPSRPRMDAYHKYYGSVCFQGVSALHMGAEEAHTVLAAFCVPKGGLGMMDLRVNHSPTATPAASGTKRGRDGVGRPPLVKSNLMTATYYLDYGYSSLASRGRGNAAAAAAATALAQQRHRMYFPFVEICRAHPFHYTPCPEQAAQRVAAIYSSSSAVTPHPVILLSEEADVFCTSWSALTSGSVVAASASYQRYKSAQQQQQQQEEAQQALCSTMPHEVGQSSAPSSKRTREIPSHQSILARLRRVEGGRHSGTDVPPPAAMARGKTHAAQGVLLFNLSARHISRQQPPSDLFVSTDKTHRSLLVRAQGRHATGERPARDLTIPLPFGNAQPNADVHVASMSGCDNMIAVHSSCNETCYIKLD